jgi:hypothetical protein
MYINKVEFMSANVAIHRLAEGHTRSSIFPSPQATLPKGGGNKILRVPVFTPTKSLPCLNAVNENL